MGNWKKFIMGEKMPDKDDPQYKDKYEKDVDAGRRFAKWSKLDKVAARVQHFANNHTKAFLTIVFGFIFISFAIDSHQCISCDGHQQNTPARTCGSCLMVR